MWRYFFMTCKCCDNISIYMWRVKVFWLILWRNVCVTCEVFVIDLLCDVWKLCDWYCDDVSVWHVKVLWCGDIVTMFQSVWGVKVLWSGDIVSMFLCDVWKICFWYRYCDDVFVWEWRFFVTLEAAWQYFFFWINFDFGPRGPDCGPTGRNLWLWC